MTKREFEITDPDEIREIVEDVNVLHMGLSDDNVPYVLAMNYGSEYTNDGLVLYMHCALKGKKLDIIRKNPLCAIEIDRNVEAFPGKVACQYGTSYESVMCMGRAGIVEDVDEKIHALSVFMKSQTGKDFEFNEKLVSIVSIIKVEVEEITAKRRPKPKNPMV